ncbi:MAG: N-acetylmuramoyl-L-alanine amidase [Clostridiales bacterium]|nr:N-acetylmuramoyl-L-alanine amidase [Clostridiales bacterium]
MASDQLEDEGIEAEIDENYADDGAETDSDADEYPALTVDDFDLDAAETMYATARVNVRTAPSTDSDVYEVLGTGKSVTRVADDGSWSTVVIDDSIYYVASAYLSEDEPVVTETATSSSGWSSTVKIPAVSEPTGEANGFLVVIDPGHQSRGNSGKEPIGPGASETKAKVTTGTKGVSTGLAEYELNLEVAIKLREVLLERGYEVIMCRTTNDVDLSNSERAQIANEAGADVFIRLHADGMTDSSINGAVAMCQTSSNPYNGSLYSQSRALADDVLSSYVAKTGAKKHSVQETDTMSGINWASVPCTILEMGYMTNAAEDQKMASSDYQNLMAEGIADGIDKFLLGN